MKYLSKIAQTLIGSEIVRLGNEVKLRMDNGEKIYNYTIGDFDPDIFPIPNHLKQEIINAYKRNYTNYPSANGLSELRLSVIQYIKEHTGLMYKMDEIQIASGGRPLIYSLFRTIVDKDDKVIYAVPSWNNNHYVHMNEGVHCVIETYPENSFMPSAKDIAQHIQGATLLCLCTPQNPTGTTFSKEELGAICDLVIEENEKRSEQEKKLYVMFDQMYFMLTYGNTKHYDPVSLRPKMKDYTIFIDGISKTFAATGVRVGWAMGPAYVIAKMKTILTHIGAWAPMAEQKATAAFLQNNKANKNFLEHFKKEVQDRLLMLYVGFIQLKSRGFPVNAIYPQASIYLTVKIDLVGKFFDNGKTLNTQTEVTEYLLDTAKLAIVPFYAFGASKDSPWYRLSVGTCKKDEIREMFEKLEEALAGI